MKRNTNPYDYPHEINPIKDKYGVRSYAELAKLSKDGNVLDSLAQQHWDNPEVCRYVAKNFNTLKNTLEKLSKHPDDVVRAGVAEQKDLDLKVAFRLAFDKSISVRIALSRATNYDSIKKFLIKYNYHISRIVTNIIMKPENKGLIHEFISTGDFQLIKAFLKNGTFKSEYLKVCLEEQLKNPDLHFVKDVLNHKNCTEEIGNFILENFALLNLTAEEVGAIKNFVD